MSRLIATRAACAALCSLSLALIGCSGSSSDAGDSSGLVTAGAGSGGPATASGGSHSQGGKATHDAAQAAHHHGAVQTCTLITQAEATKALGEAAAPGEHDPDSDSPTDCTWGAADIEHFSTFVNVDVEPVVNFQDAVTHIKETAEAGFVLTKIPGLGDDAFTVYAKSSDPSHVHLFDNLQVKQGDVALIINVLSPSLTRAQGFAADKAVAQAALDRL